MGGSGRGDGGGMSAATDRADAQESACAELRNLFPPGSTVHTILRHVSRSGMSRAISVVGAGSNDVTWLVARAMGEKIDPNHGGIKVGGCGMDMGFALVYSLSRTLYPGDSFQCCGEGCPSNDHSNGDRDYSPHVHSDGGYALRQRWL